MTQQMRARLRAVPVLTGSAPELDVSALPWNPVAMFYDWFDQAVSAAVAEPHTMTVSTVDERGVPDARVLTLKDVDERGWAFASTQSSIQGQQLAVCPNAALTFWWQPIMRSVRIRGAVVQASAEESLADLRARSAAAQQDVDPDDWIVWRVVAERVEFWQGSTDRRHQRLVYERQDADWQLHL